MAEVSGVAIRGIATAVPRTVARIADYPHMTAEEAERFSKSTGIRERRIVTGGQCASDLCQAAATDLLGRLAWPSEEIGALIMITQTGDHPVPATAILLQHRLGLPNTCIAFDVNLGCSSYPYGLMIVGSLMKTAGIKRALLVIGDVSSKVCNVEDKSSWPLFGDAGSATALELDESAAPMHFDLMTDGRGSQAIIIPGGGPASRHPVSAESLVPQPDKNGLPRNMANLQLRGADIFSFAISKVPPSITRALQSAQWAPESVDQYVLHQANKMINDTIRKKIGAPEGHLPSSLEHFGNTSSVSIPLTICHTRASWSFPCRALFAGFGVGLSWGAATAVLPAGTVLSWVETDDVHRA
ncbi:MAG TPA: ketoacyl-ACP synthase III [Burkholderiales bacterium]|jgi:3-oxoacyl-[acyl-carrier-protein] synthase-3